MLSETGLGKNKVGIDNNNDNIMKSGERKTSFSNLVNNTLLYAFRIEWVRPSDT